MNSIVLNNLEADAGGDKWIFYHLPIKCRGNFVRLVLEECGIEYLDAYGIKFMIGMLASPKAELNGPKPMPRGCCNPGTNLAIWLQVNNDEIIEKSLIPPEKDPRNNPNRIWIGYGSPFLVNFDNPNVCFSQAPICTQYLAHRYGLRPKSDIDHYRAGMIVSNCNDFFDLIFLKANSLISMQDLKKYDQEIMKFINGECQIWLNILSKPLQDQLYYFDNRITQCDLAVYNIMDCWYELFINDEKLMNEFVWKPYPNLKRHYLNIIEKSKSIKGLMKRQKENGINWWPLNPDALGISKLRNSIKRYGKSKYSKL